MALTSEQEQVYRFLLSNPGADPSTASLPLKDPAAALEGLNRFGLVDERLMPITPAAAVDRLVRLRIEETARDLHQIGALWDVVRDLTDAQHGRRPVELVERIEGLESVQRRIDEYPAKESLAMKRKAKAGNRRPGSDAVFRRKMVTGLRSRTIVHADSLRDPAQLAHAREMEALGDLHRVIDDEITPFIILDRARVFVRADPGDHEPGALLIRQPGMVATLVDMFEHIWSRARTLDEPELTALERQVLQALCTFSKDELAARAVNVSIRKFRAHVADLMARLGAASRFQAALMAREKGWI
ncbi:hypothetical protein ACIBG8_26365 [Nonomuraea sp. NPDC050556]|uniref:hypothetical protein n=1 Tax=Nonomuraea sp. NPDC050556 TaxID=3364369 RepID=UPI0037B62ED6